MLVFLELERQQTPSIYTRWAALGHSYIVSNQLGLVRALKPSVDVIKLVDRQWFLEVENNRCVLGIFRETLWDRQLLLATLLMMVTLSVISVKSMVLSVARSLLWLWLFIVERVCRHSVGLLHELGLTRLTYVLKSNILVLYGPWVRHEKVLHVRDSVTLRSERRWLEAHSLSLEVLSSLKRVLRLI